MNANYETIVSLVSLLVKKAGFDIMKDYSETELEKTKNTIAELTKEKTKSTNNKKVLASALENLKVRQANWENNAEIVGKSILSAYKEGKDYNSVKMRIELLGNLANKGTTDISVGLVYDKIKSLESEYQKLLAEHEGRDYKNLEEKEMDTKYKTYLENKIKDFTSEIEALEKESESLREVEIKDVNIVAKLKDYVKKLESDLEKVNGLLNSSINSDIAFDVWERLETAKSDTEEKFEKSKDLLTKTEAMLEEVKINMKSVTERMKSLEDEKSRCNTKLNNVNIKLEEDNYDNVAARIIDENKLEVMRLELETLNNKKEVIYVDANKVKDELIKEWNKVKEVVKQPEIVKEPPKEEVKEEKIEKKPEVKDEPEEILSFTKEIDIPKEKVEIKENKVIEEKQEERIETTKEEVKPPVKEEVVKEPIKEEKKNKIELDW